MQVRVTEESIQNASAAFWQQMLAMHLSPIAFTGPAFADPASTNHDHNATQARCIGAEHLFGSCDLAGVWIGSIEVRLSRGLALEATATMLMQPADSVQPEDTLDATREIANMIAGTIKSALPRPCTMSVPSAHIELGDFCTLPRTPDSVTVFFHHPAGELMIRVWQEAPLAEADAQHHNPDCAAPPPQLAPAY